MRNVFLLLSCVLLACGGASPQAAPAAALAPPVDWQPWSREAFEEAAASGKNVLVSVQAVWCHWCHVMNDETFTDRAVRAALAEHYVAIKVDSDARPDLAERFRNYAWPATVVLTPEGEIVRAMRGYRPAEPFAQLLLAAARGEVLAEEVPAEGSAPAEFEALRDAAVASLDGLYDQAQGGWGQRQKYPYFAPLEHAFFRAARGDEVWRERARQTLLGTAHLIDPVFGGAYQYSLRGRWNAPHFEKIAAVQADVLAGFSRALLDGAGDERHSNPSVRLRPFWPDDWGRRFYVIPPRRGAATRSSSFLASPPPSARPERTQANTGVAGSAARAMVSYLKEFFSASDGAFYTSQDADLNHETTGDAYYAMNDEARRALGFPRLDRNHYVDLNARMISALALAYRVGIEDAGEMALAAANAIASLQRDDGGFDHGRGPAQGDETDPMRFLRDQGYAIRAFLDAYEISGEGRYRLVAERAADFCLEVLKAERGFYGHTEDPAAFGALAQRRTPLLENGVLARGLLELARRSGEARYLEGADHALSAGSLASVRREGRRIGEFLMALEERLAPYALVSVVGPDSDETGALHRGALELSDPLALIELGRPGESRYPFPGEPAAYMCNSAACSRPVFRAGALAERLQVFFAAE